MTVWIVLSNGKIDKVFDNQDAANYHRIQLRNKFAIAKVVEKEVIMI